MTITATQAKEWAEELQRIAAEGQRAIEEARSKMEKQDKLETDAEPDESSTA